VSKIDQYTSYAKKILELFKMKKCKAVTAPRFEVQLDEVDPKLQSEYRAIVGSLMYLPVDTS
jgi:hypothetical protein